MNLEPRTYVVKWFVPSARNFDRDTTQVIKGLLAIGIVLHHLALHTHTGYPLEFFVYLGRPIVTMFFFISGYGLLSSVMRQGIRYFDTFLSKRFGSLLKPYLVCIVIYQIFSYCIGEFPLSLHQIGQDLRVGNTHSFFPSWFVPVILYLYFSFFVSFHFLSRKTGSGIAVCILLSLVYVAFTKELMNWEMFWWDSTLAFNAGMIWKYYEVEILNIMNRRITSAATLALLLAASYIITLQHH